MPARRQLANAAPWIRNGVKMHESQHAQHHMMRRVGFATALVLVARRRPHRNLAQTVVSESDEVGYGGFARTRGVCAFGATAAALDRADAPRA